MTGHQLSKVADALAVSSQQRSVLKQHNLCLACTTYLQTRFADLNIEPYLATSTCACSGSSAMIILFLLNLQLHAMHQSLMA